MEYRYIIKRYEDTDKDRIVGFDVLNSQSAKKYFESLIPLVECKGKSDNEVCCLAYEKIKIKIHFDMESIKEETPTIFGSEFIPPDIERGYEFNI